MTLARTTAHPVPRSPFSFVGRAGRAARALATVASALALAAGVLALVPATVGEEKLRQVLDVADSVTIYKAGRTLPQILAELRDHHRQAVVGTDVSLPSEQLARPDQVAADATAPYFSAVLSTPRRTTTGGSL